tara:strand:- start:1711 stop:2526 length:816 start_codon:yes stop_codon:yes gene_type:complete
MLIYAIDVSKEHLDIFSKSEGEIMFKKRIKNNLTAVSKFLSLVGKQDIICAEFTGIYSDLLLHLANCYDIKIALVDGYRIKHSIGNPRGKSDLIDAVRIWYFANRFLDQLTFTQFDTDLMVELKKLFNLRNQLVKALKMLNTALQVFYEQEGDIALTSGLERNGISFRRHDVDTCTKTLLNDGYIEESNVISYPGQTFYSITANGRIFYENVGYKDNTTQFDKIVKWAKNNKFLAWVVIIFITISALIGLSDKLIDAYNYFNKPNAKTQPK